MMRLSALLVACMSSQVACYPSYGDHILAKQLLEHIYKNLSNPHTQQSDRIQNPGAGDAVVYGEILPDSVYHMMQRAEDTLEDAFLPRNDFWDLGSGGGKVVMQQFLEGSWRRTFGVELVTRRYLIAFSALMKLKKLVYEKPCSDLCMYARSRFWRFQDDGKLPIYQEIPEVVNDTHVCVGDPDYRQICYINGDMLKQPMMANASCVFMCSTCFPKDLMNNLVHGPFQTLQPGAAIISLKELPDKITVEDGVEFAGNFTEDMTWRKADPVHVYKRSEYHTGNSLMAEALEAHVHNAKMYSVL